MLDIVAYWQKTFDDDKAKNKKHDETYIFIQGATFLDPDPKTIQPWTYFMYRAYMMLSMLVTQPTNKTVSHKLPYKFRKSMVTTLATLDH